MTGKKNIEYSEKSINFVTGCYGVVNGTCAVGMNCWAYKMSFRQAGRNGYPAKPNQFKPTFHEERLKEPLRRKKPTNYACCFMGDIAYAKKEWLVKIINMVNQCPQHRFIFLTKRPDLLAKMNLVFPDNCIVGVTVNREEDAWRIKTLAQIMAKWKWVSFEPIYGRLKFIPNLLDIQWAVIGAQTNPELQPDKEGVSILIECFKVNHIPVFLKPNLKGFPPMQELPAMLRRD